MSIIDILCLIFLAGAVLPYLIAILRRKAQPVRSTWLVWATLDAITLGSMYMKGTLSVYMTGCVIGCVAIMLLSLRYGKAGWTRIDLACLVGAGLAVGAWALSGDPLFGMLTSLSATLVGTIPTWVSAWQDPSREDKFAWIMGTISALFALLAITEWSVATAAQPVAFVLINGTIAVILLIRPRMM